MFGRDALTRLATVPQLLWLNPRDLGVTSVLAHVLMIHSMKYNYFCVT